MPKSKTHKRTFLIKLLSFITIFISEVLVMKLFIDTAETPSFDYLAFNFQSTELPLYFLLILLVLSKGEIFKIKSRFEKKQSLYIIPHVFFITAFYFLTIFVIENPSLVAENVLLFKILWYGAAVLPLVFLGLILFSFKEIKNLISGFKKEIAISFVLSFLFLYLFQALSSLLYNIGMLAANSAIALLKSVSDKLVVYREQAIIIRYGINNVTYSPLCSGVVGYVFYILFTILYLIVNYKKTDKVKAAIAFITGFLFFFLMDLIRNFVSLYVWTKNPVLGVQLFHSNVRPIYYTINLIIIYLIFKRWTLKKSNKTQKHSKKN